MCHHQISPITSKPKDGERNIAQMNVNFSLQFRIKVSPAHLAVADGARGWCVPCYIYYDSAGNYIAHNGPTWSNSASVGLLNREVFSSILQSAESRT
jgi:hypothetical protein